MTIKPEPDPEAGAISKPEAGRIHWPEEHVGPHASRRFFLLQRKADHVPVAVVDANGMNWGNAVAALIREGMLASIAEGSGEAVRGSAFRWGWLPGTFNPEAHPDVPLLKAPKRAAGTAPTNRFTADLYRRWLEALMAEPEDYPLPPLDRDARRLIDDMAEAYREAKRSGQLPATPRQLAYVAAICNGLQLPMPDGGPTDEEQTGPDQSRPGQPKPLSRRQANIFITQHVEAFRFHQAAASGNRAETPILAPEEDPSSCSDVETFAP